MILVLLHVSLPTVATVLLDFVAGWVIAVRIVAALLRRRIARVCVWMHEKVRIIPFLRADPKAAHCAGI